MKTAGAQANVEQISSEGSRIDAIRRRLVRYELMLRPLADEPW